MKSLLLLIAAATTADLVRGQYVCDIPTNGCTNGMFNQELCECQCIVPFCHDLFGDCTNPSNACGGNPWVQCERGVNCPWFTNPLKLGGCTTGPNVLADVWDVYSTRDACCNSNFPYSDTCVEDPNEEGGPPTKHPTIDAPEDDDYEVVAIKFDIKGLPDGISMRKLKDETTTVMKRILIRMQDSITGLKISNVEEKVVLTRNLVKTLRERALETDVTLYYNVYIVRDDDKKFGPLIIQEIRDSYSEVLEQIQQFTDTNFFGGDLDLNWCTSQNGKYEDCVNDNPSPPTPVRAPTPAFVQSGPDSGGDPGGDPLAGWAIALIIIFVILLLCCIGYLVFVSCFKNYDDNKEVHNNIYMDDGYDGYDGRSRASGYDRNRGMDDKSRASGYTSRRSQRTNEDCVQIVLAEPMDPKFDDDSFTVNTYGTKQKQGRDPTMYIPGQENRPDPDSGRSINSRSISSRRYLEDPPLKPKRDPTMYVEGHYGAEDPPLKPKRDPTMYVEGQLDPSIYGEEASVGTFSVGRGKEGSVGYGSDPYGMGGIEEDDEYDQYGFSHSELDAEYMTSETNAEHVRGRRDPSYYDDPSEVVSVRTQDPSVSGKSGRSKQSKSKKSKTSSRTRG